MILVAASAAQPAPAVASPIEAARIVRHSARPCCGSGVFHFTVTYEVEAPGGARHLLYQTYFGPDDFIAPAQSRCTIWFTVHVEIGFVHERHGEETAAPHLMIDRMRCDSGAIG